MNISSFVFLSVVKVAAGLPRPESFQVLTRLGWKIKTRFIEKYVQLLTTPNHFSSPQLFFKTKQQFLIKKEPLRHFQVKSFPINKYKSKIIYKINLHKTEPTLFRAKNPEIFFSKLFMKCCDKYAMVKWKIEKKIKF